MNADYKHQARINSW